MLSESEYQALNEKIKGGIMPSEEELKQILEYTQAETLKMIEKQNLQLTCPHCSAPIPQGTLTCEYCGGNAFDAPQQAVRRG